MKENPKKISLYAPNSESPFWPIHQEVDLEAGFGFSGGSEES